MRFVLKRRWRLYVRYACACVWGGRYMSCCSQVNSADRRWEEVLSRSILYVCTHLRVLAQRSSSCSQRELVKCHQGYEKGAHNSSPFCWASLPETNIGYDGKG